MAAALVFVLRVERRALGAKAWETEREAQSLVGVLPWMTAKGRFQREFHGIRGALTRVYARFCAVLRASIRMVVPWCGSCRVAAVRFGC